MFETSKKHLTAGWRIVRLGDVVENVNDFFGHNSGETIRYVAGEHIDEGNLLVRRYGMTSDDLVPPTFNRLFKAGDVLFHSRNIRKLAQPDFDGLTGEKLFVLRTKDQKQLMQGLLPFLLQSENFLQYVQARWAGSTNKFLNKTPLMAYEFALPPTEEQESVIALLKAATDHCHAIEDAHHAAGRMLQAFKDSQLGRGGSELKPYLLGDLLLGSPESGCSAPPKDDATGYFVLGLAALSRDGYVPGDFKPVEPTSKMLTAKLAIGDMLISRSNTVDRVGYVGIFSDDRDDVSFPDTMMRLRPNPALIRPDFLEALLQTTSAREYLMRIAAGTSASMKKINRANLLQMRLNVPRLDVQESALGQIREQKNAIAALKSRADAARRLTRFIVTRATGGAA